MWHVIPEREKNITTKNKKAAYENMKASRRSNSASSKGKGKNCLNHLKLGMEPEEDVKGHFLRDKQRSRERTEEN